MLKNDRERNICAKYSAYDDTGYVHCKECPLRLPQVAEYGACKAIMHYDRHKRDWLYDEVLEEKE